MTFMPRIFDQQVRMNSLYFLDKPLLTDNIDGNNTRAAFKQAQERYGFKSVADMMDPSGITRIHLHWTASSYKVTSEVASHYNDVFDDKGVHYPGGAKPEDQARYSVGQKIGVSHTLSANTGAIGMAVAAMAGATVNGVRVAPGPYPMTWVQIDEMLKKAIQYCMKFDIKISPWTVLTHAEIQPTLGIKQNGKWDICVLPDDMNRLLSPVQAGDILRERMKDLI